MFLVAETWRVRPSRPASSSGLCGPLHGSLEHPGLAPREPDGGGYKGGAGCSMLQWWAGMQPGTLKLRSRQVTDEARQLPVNGLTRLTRTRRDPRSVTVGIDAWASTSAFAWTTRRALPHAQAPPRKNQRMPNSTDVL